MKAFTDYPFDGEVGVYEVKMLAYDRNKYVKIDVDGEIEEIKAGYLFKDEKLTKNFSINNLLSLPIVLNEPKPNKKQVHREVMKIKRMKNSSYSVRFVSNFGKSTFKRFKNFCDALKFFDAKSSNLNEDSNVVLYKNQHRKNSFVTKSLAEFYESDLYLCKGQSKATKFLITNFNRKIGNF